MTDVNICNNFGSDVLCDVEIHFGGFFFSFKKKFLTVKTLNSVFIVRDYRVEMTAHGCFSNY